MAKLSDDKTYVTVERGDSLWSIAATYLGDGTKWKTLAAINDVPKSNLILVGDKIYLKKQTSTTPTTKKKASTNKAVIQRFGIQASDRNSIFATWKWTKDHVDNYRIVWQYYTKDKMWIYGEDSTTNYKYSIYSIDSKATRVRFRVKPISKKYKVKEKVKGKNGKTTTKEYEKYYWTAEWSEWKTHNITEAPPDTPSSPTVKIEGTKLTASLDNLDTKVTACEFHIVKNNKTFKTGTAKVKARSVSYSCKIDLGGEYKVRCRAIKGELKSGWSDYSSISGTAPSTPKEIIWIKTLSETSVQMNWTNVSNSTNYVVEYTTQKKYFDSSNEVSSLTVDAKVAGHAEVTGLSSGERYFFRVKATNGNGESGWTPIKDIVVGKEPSAPTTWSSTTTATTGEDVILYWVHNSEDGSSQTYAQLELIVDGVNKSPDPIKNTNTGDDIDKTSRYVLKTSTYRQGTKIKWRVRTKGILNKWGDWSIQRVIDVYASPTLELTVYKNATSSDTSLDVVDSFPFYISAIAGPSTQKPISYHLSVVAAYPYDTVDELGNTKTVSGGEEVYSRNFNISTDLIVEMSAGNIDLENGQDYIVTCTVAMDSGLTAEETTRVFVDWIEEAYIPNAELGIDYNTYSALIRPYCSENEITYYKVEKIDGQYRIGEKIDDDVYGDILMENNIAASTVNGRLVYSGVNSDGEDILYCIDDDSENMIEGVKLAVYRREFDGEFTEIASDLDNTSHTFITDLHPALDYARYRIVARTESTGAVAYYDLPSVPVGGKEIIIQWDETPYSFDIDLDGVEDDIEDSIDQPVMAGSMLKLPYNIDVSDKYGPDVELVEYIGRKHPVSYYGTQRGESSTWNVDIEKTDEETIYQLRRLATYPGNAYVREPSGSGYWAHVIVSFSQKHRELTIPVTLDITRVEGGM